MMRVQVRQHPLDLDLDLDSFINSHRLVVHHHQ